MMSNLGRNPTAPESDSEARKVLELMREALRPLVEIAPKLLRQEKHPQ